MTSCDDCSLVVDERLSHLFINKVIRQIYWNMFYTLPISIVFV